MCIINLVCLKNQTLKECIINIQETADQFHFCTHIDETELIGSGDSMFMAFQKLMDQLYDLGYGMNCQGARINAMQSTMAYASDKIYLLTLGQQAMNKDLVSMFEGVELNEYCLSDKQVEFAQQWLESLK